MKKGEFPGDEATRRKGWIAAHKFLILRRLSQLSLLAIFLVGPIYGIWIVKGNMASSLTLGVLPLTDPLVALQTFFASHSLESEALLGAVLVLIFYLVVGGRVYCSWMCPINMITDAAEWFRRKFNLKGGAHFARQTRYWFLAAILLLALITGTIAYELINPVSIVFRGLIFGMGSAWGLVVGIFLLDLFIARNAWCGHLCPVGAFYSLIGKVSILRITADNREACDDCMDCFAVCPEAQVIRPALKGNDSPIIESGKCTNCARCIDVCAEDVFHLTHRFNKQLSFNIQTQETT